jgi:Domain of unknown function (DUF4082)
VSVLAVCTLNTGTHLAHLWSPAGALLAEAAFVNETASGWQEVALPTPVQIAANTIYVASYHADSGYFAFDQDSSRIASSTKRTMA